MKLFQCLLSRRSNIALTLIASIFLSIPSHALLVSTLGASPWMAAVGGFFAITGPMKIDWDNNNTAHRDWGLFAFGVVLLDAEDEFGHIKFYPFNSKDRPETYDLTKEEFKAYESEWFMLNTLINEIASKNFPATEEGKEQAKAEWLRYIEQGTISKDTLSAAAKIMNKALFQ
jgi:hypothetical protein